MGFEAISDAGKMIEDLWRGIKSGEIEPYPNLGRALVALAGSLNGATDADPDTGSPEMVEAMDKLNRATGYVLGEPREGAPVAPAVAPQPAPADPDSVAPATPEPAPPPEARIADVVPLPGAIPVVEEDPVPAPPQAGVAPPQTEEPASPQVEEPAPAPQQSEEPASSPPHPSSTAEPQAEQSHAPAPQVAAPPPPPAVAPSPEQTPAPSPLPETPDPNLQGVVSARTVPLDPGPSHREMIGTATDDEPELYGPDLGGLLSSLENWATGQTIQVSAGRLYRLINYVASLRVELDSVLGEIRYGPEVTLDTIEHLTDLVRVTSALERDAMELGAVPVRQMTNTLPQLVRYLAKKLGKEVRFEISAADDLDVDRQVLDKISDPVRQLIVNAVNHGIEPPAEREAAGKPATGVISVSLERKGRSFEVVVVDDGRGIDYNRVHQLAVSQGLVSADAPVDIEMLRPILFFPGFTTRAGDELNSVGAGLSNVADAVESLYGRIRVESKDGAGTTVTLLVPTVRDLQRVLIVDSGGTKWGIPEAVIESVVPIESAQIATAGDRQILTYEGNEIPLAPIANVVGATDTRPPVQVVAMVHRAGAAAVSVNEVLGIREVAAKELGAVVAGPSHITGAALMGGGDVVLVLDAGAVVQMCQEVPAPVAPRSKILVVDDSQGARAVIAGSLASSGFSTSVAESAFEALDILNSEQIDALVVDFSMPAQDGVELVKKVRAAGIRVPIVMLSGVAKAEDQQRALEAGVDAFFEKADFREGALAAQLRSLLE
jgi:chemotaxis protein histidine kinase CheA